MVKVANKSVKTVDKRKNIEDNSAILLLLFNKMNYNNGIKKLINYDLTDKAESSKHDVINNYVDESRKDGKWIYLASSHGDCAKDHLPYQGKLYYDEKAPDYIVEYCQSKGYESIQWVMGAPAWFITRPNCRHFFKSLNFDVVKQYGIKELKRRYKTHRKVGDERLKTPAKVAVEEYEDRLRMLRGMYKEHPTEYLRREIEKIELLVKKWKNML